MIFWRRKKNQAEQEQEAQDNRLLHHPGEPEIEPSTDSDESVMGEELRHDLHESEAEIVDTLHMTPVPKHGKGLDEADQDSWLSKLSRGLTKSSGKLTKGIADVLVRRKLDKQTLADLEDLLVAADLGPATAARLIEALAEGRFEKDIGDQEVREILADEITRILDPVTGALKIEKPANGPFVILVAGVNGVGKTTTIGKIARYIHLHDHKTVMLAAGDTFRAAAVEQLEIWANRNHCALYKKDIGADAAAVAFEAYTKAVADKTDVLLIDTAGRLHNKANLMAELEKIVRVLKKQNEALPHEVLLVLDATTGQNAHAQVEAFKDMVNVSGLIVTKLDGSAKGGVVVSLADKFELPIYAIGVGEGIDDLQPFHAGEFAKSLVGLE